MIIINVGSTQLFCFSLNRSNDEVIYFLRNNNPRQLFLNSCDCNGSFSPATNRSISVCCFFKQLTLRVYSRFNFFDKPNYREIQLSCRITSDTVVSDEESHSFYVLLKRGVGYSMVKVVIVLDMCNITILIQRSASQIYMLRIPSHLHPLWSTQL